MARTFDDVQAFFEFLTVLNDATKRVTTDGVTVDLLTNLDSSGKTNLAIELAKIYSWYQNMVDYNLCQHLQGYSENRMVSPHKPDGSGYAARKTCRI